MCECDLLSMLAVFSVVISISGSVKYSDATHLPFSGPEREKKGTDWDRQNEARWEGDIWVTSNMEILAYVKETRIGKKQTKYRNREKGQTESETERRQGHTKRVRQEE